MSDSENDERKRHAVQLRAVMDAMLATGIEPGLLPPLMAGVAGMLLGEHIAKAGAGAREIDIGLGLVSLTMRVAASIAARHGDRESAMAALTKYGDGDA